MTTATWSSPSRPSSPPALWRRAVGMVGAAWFGLVLLVAAYAKLLDPASFVEQIHLEGLDFLLSAKVLAYLALGLEVGLGCLLALGIRRFWTLVPALLLTGFFLFLTGRGWYLEAQGLRPEAASCGCFGNLVERTPEEAFWQDLALLVPPLALAFVGLGAAPPRVSLRIATAGLATAGALAFAAQAPSLPLDDVATRLKAGVKTAELCSGRGAERACLGLAVMPELGTGEHLVVMAEVGDRALTAAKQALDDYALAGNGPRLWLLTPSPLEDVTRFRWTGPAFEVREAPLVLLRPLYRTLPRSFLVKDGIVVRTFGGLPPLGEFAG